MSGDKEKSSTPTTVYLGDGAYVAFNGFDFELYTSIGVSVQDRVVLEPQALQTLVRFAQQLGMKFETKL